MGEVGGYLGTPLKCDLARARMIFSKPLAGPLFGLQSLDPSG